jgi:flagellar basal body-associated protein FliL
MRTTSDSGMKTSTIILIVVGALLIVGGTMAFVILSKKK